MASTRLTGELLERVRACACARVTRAPAVSYAALERSRGTLEDFARTYLPLHGLEPFDFMRFMPQLCFVEAAIYAADEENERLAAGGALDRDGALSQSEAAIVGVLEAHGWLTESVRAHLRSGQTYWALERSVCRAMLTRDLVREADVLLAHELKSFDYRLLNALLYELRGLPPDQPTLDFLRVDELLTDIADDLYDYEDDVVRGSFNVYRGFVHVYGAHEAQGRLAARISDLEAQHAERLSALAPSAQRAFHTRMDEVFARPGTRRWQLPTPIEDEHAYRASALREEAMAASRAAAAAADCRGDGARPRDGAVLRRRGRSHALPA